MTLSRLPTRCAHCKAKFLPEEQGLRIHPSCVDGWYAAHKAKQEKARAAKLKKATAIANRVLRERKAAMKTIPDLIKEAQREFNKWCRTRDREQPCISCGAPPPDMSGLHAGRDAGHYRSVGSASHLRFHEDNVHAQCVHCNQWGAGRAVDYRIGLVGRIGLERVELLESDNSPRKWTREELISIRDTYKAKRKELEKSKE